MTYILPKPKYMKINAGTYRLKYNTKIVIDSKCSIVCLQYAYILREEIHQATGLYLEIVKGNTMEGQINLNICEELHNAKGNSVCNREGYSLNIDESGVTINGNAEAGLLYGVQTFRQIVRQEYTAISYMEITDSPDMDNRGYYFDCTRGRVPTLESLKKIADTCSFYKINQLQLYVEHTYLFQNESEVWRDNTPLTAEEIMELDLYCGKLNIELVPSLASFGHLYTMMQTNSFCHLCELDVNTSDGYSMVKRMRHHTVDVTNEESFKLVAGRIEEYMQLFTSKKFNICADETFDLGKGKSKELAEKTSVTDVYVGFLKRLCEIVLDKGRIPMFWGDILVSHPEKTSVLPKEAICLNWDYWPDSKEESTRRFAEAGVKHLYVCPGVQGWNHFIPNHQDAYDNISRMCSYGHKYHAEGVLTTDWGDLGHVAYPEFSNVGVIYGASFSWNKNIDTREEINRKISHIEYGDKTGCIVDIFTELAKAECINWWCTVQFYEYLTTGMEDLKTEGILLTQEMEENESRLKKIDVGIEALYDIIPNVVDKAKEIIYAYILMAEGQRIMSNIAFMIELKKNIDMGTGYAIELEKWLYQFKKLWRNVSKESELHRTSKVFMWYADRARLEAMEK